MPGASVEIDGRPLPIDADGRFVLGFGRDAREARLVVSLPGGARETRLLAIAPRRFDVQRIDGLPPATVTPDPADLARIAREREAVRAARVAPSPAAQNGPVPRPFVWPATGPISGVWGSQRILNGEPRQPHYGVDVAAPRGTPVGAAAPGIVRLAETLFLTGNTVIVAHGHGLTTTYAHLDRLFVRVGDEVASGTPLGELGATGRVTGPHLHWSLEWGEVRLDPALAVGPMPPH